MSFPESLAMKLRAAYLHLHRSANRHFAQFELTADQYAVLTCLAEQQPLTQQELVKLCASDKRTIGKMLDLLDESGLIERQPCPTDRRAWAVFLTRRGRNRQKEVYASADFLRRRLEEAVPPEHLQTVLDCLQRVATRLDPDGLTAVLKPQRKRRSVTPTPKS